jgi:hypothetical protein
LSFNIEDLIWVDRQKSSPLAVHVYLYVDTEYQKIHTMSKRIIPELADTNLTQCVVTSLWTIPTRAEMEEYRRQSSTFNVQTGTVLVDEIAVSDCVVTHHILGLIIDGKSVDLEREENSPLPLKSLRKLKSLHSGLYDLIYDKYRAEACLFT